LEQLFLGLMPFL